MISANKPFSELHINNPKINGKESQSFSPHKIYQVQMVSRHSNKSVKHHAHKLSQNSLLSFFFPLMYGFLSVTYGFVAFSGIFI